MKTRRIDPGYLWQLSPFLAPTQRALLHSHAHTHTKRRSFFSAVYKEAVHNKKKGVGEGRRRRRRREGRAHTVQRGEIQQLTDKHTLYVYTPKMRASRHGSQRRETTGEVANVRVQKQKTNINKKGETPEKGRTGIARARVSPSLPLAFLLLVRPRWWRGVFYSCLVL